MEKYTVYDIINARCNSQFDSWNCAYRNPKNELIFTYSGRVIDESDCDSDSECAKLSNATGIVKNYCALRSVSDSAKYTTLFQLWGHKDSVTVELSHSVIKRNKIDVTRECYTKLNKDKNDNFITTDLESALAIIDDFMSQLYKNYSILIYSNPIATTVNRKSESAIA